MSSSGNSDGPPVSALGYMTANGTARIDDPELKHQSAAIEDFCAREGWELVMLVRDIQPKTGRALNRPALRYAIERLGRGDASALVVAELGAPLRIGRRATRDSRCAPAGGRPACVT